MQISLFKFVYNSFQIKFAHVFSYAVCKGGGGGSWIVIIWKVIYKEMFGWVVELVWGVEDPLRKYCINYMNKLYIYIYIYSPHNKQV